MSRNVPTLSSFFSRTHPSFRLLIFPFRTFYFVVPLGQDFSKPCHTQLWIRLPAWKHPILVPENWYSASMALVINLWGLSATQISSKYTRCSKRTHPANFIITSVSYMGTGVSHKVYDSLSLHIGQPVLGPTSKVNHPAPDCFDIRENCSRIS